MWGSSSCSPSMPWAGTNAPPYSAISSVALEPLYLSLEPWTIPGLEERVFNETGDTLPWEQPSGPDLVDYPKVRFWKMWILRGSLEQFQNQAGI